MLYISKLKKYKNRFIDARVILKIISTINATFIRVKNISSNSHYNNSSANLVNDLNKSCISDDLLISKYYKIN